MEWQQTSEYQAYLELPAGSALEVTFFDWRYRAAGSLLGEGWLTLSAHTLDDAKREAADILASKFEQAAIALRSV